MTEEPKPELSANWTTPEETPEAIPQGEPDIAHNDLTPSVIEQAKSSGWECAYYYFGKLEDQGNDFFNPGLIQREDGIYLLVRASGPHPSGFMYGQNSIIAFKCDDEGKRPINGKVLHWPVENQQQHFEDPRGFYHEGLGQTMIGCCTFLWNGPGDWTGALQVFGAFDWEWNCKKMDYPKIGGNPSRMEKIQPKNYEKNWCWFLHDNHLHLLYKAHPWTMYAFGNRWSEQHEYKSEGVTWSYGEIRGGTTPVKIGDLYFTFHHSSLPWKGRYRRYYAGAIAFEAKPPFKPKLITPDPLLIGSQNDVWAQRKPLVIFPCGALYRDGKWLVSCGVNDMKSAYLELTHKSLLDRMVSVDQVGGTIFPDITPVLSGNGPHIKEPEEPGSPAQIILEKRRANAAKARAARAVKRAMQSNGEIPIVPRKRRRRRRRKPTVEARVKALQEFDAKKSVAVEEVKS